MLLNVGSGGGGAAAAPGGGTATTADAPQEEKVEEKKEEGNLYRLIEIIVIGILMLMQIPNRERGVGRGHGFWSVRLGDPSFCLFFVYLHMFWHMYGSMISRFNQCQRMHDLSQFC